MLLGFGCTVPAIMASRALENKRDRYKVMLVTPFMSCNARLTIYILFAEMFFHENAMLAAYSMYLIGILVAILVSAVLHLLDRKKSLNYLMIELPEYKLPDARTVAIYVWEKVKDYLGKAGTTIFLATIIIWALLNFGPHGFAEDMTGSFGAIIGRWLTPFFAPIGLGFCALNAFCLMVFCLLYIPCAAALAAIRKESNSWGWMGFTAFFQLAVAWLITFCVYHIALLFV